MLIPFLIEENLFGYVSEFVIHAFTSRTDECTLQTGVYFSMTLCGAFVTLRLHLQHTHTYTNTHPHTHTYSNIHSHAHT